MRVCEGVFGCLSMCERVCESVGVCERERDWKMCPISRDNALDDDWCSPLYRQSNGPSCSNYLTHSLSHLSYTLTLTHSHTLSWENIFIIIMPKGCSKVVEKLQYIYVKLNTNFEKRKIYDAGSRIYVIF